LNLEESRISNVVELARFPLAGTDAGILANPTTSGKFSSHPQPPPRRARGEKGARTQPPC
jgi:hypothetical protein